MKKIISAICVIALASTFTGCGHVKSAKSLQKLAASRYGDCELVQDLSNDKSSKIILRDKLQGFEYTFSSSMQDINIDGSSFGSLPNTSDGFYSGLSKYLQETTIKDVNAICDKYSVSLENNDIFHVQTDDNKENAINAAEEIAKLLQNYNANNRIDNWTIDISYSGAWLKNYYKTIDRKSLEDDYILSSAGGAELAHIGSVKIYDAKYRDIETEHIDNYTEFAKRCDKSAIYIKTEEKKFSELGIPLDKVSETLGQYYPKTMDDVIKVYYFKSDKQEFYICNFVDSSTYTWYTNYGNNTH